MAGQWHCPNKHVMEGVLSGAIQIESTDVRVESHQSSLVVVSIQEGPRGIDSTRWIRCPVHMVLINEKALDTYRGILHGLLHRLPKGPRVVAHRVSHLESLAQGHKVLVLILVPGVEGHTQYTSKREDWQTSE